MTLYIPPPTAEQIAWDWAKKLSQGYSVKVTVTIDRGAWGCSEMSFDPKLVDQEGKKDGD